MRQEYVLLCHEGNYLGYLVTIANTLLSLFIYRLDIMHRVMYSVQKLLINYNYILFCKIWTHTLIL